MAFNTDDKVAPNLVMLYSTCGWWKLGNKIAEKHIKLVFAEYAGVVRAIFEPSKWNQRQEDGRWEFIGTDVTESIENNITIKKYVKKLVA